jgi:phage recombination protein Bet
MAKAPTQTQTQQRPSTQAQQPWQGQDRPAQPVSTQHSQPANGKTQSAEEKTIEYIPLGETVSIKLTIDMVRRFLCVPTRSGKLPDDAEVVKYMMVCRQRKLNPWVGDCYLLGYDTKNSGPKFSIVVAVQALFKRAEIAKEFDGIESGVVVLNGDEVVERQGDLVLRGEELVGGWAMVYRKDRSKPFYQRLSLRTYSKGTPQWDSDPAGMVVKCAESGALRQAFPSDIGGLYLEQELHDTATQPADAKPAAAASTASQLKERLAGQERVVGKAPAGDATQARQEAPGEHDQTGGEEGPPDAEDAQETPPVAQGSPESAQEGDDAVQDGHDGPGVQF